MTVLNLTIAALTIGVFVGFIAWSLWQIFKEDKNQHLVTNHKKREA